MSAVDWVVLVGTLATIIVYGVWKTRNTRDMAGFLHGGYQDRWHRIGLSVMATQASAITFLSTPGQAHEDGMRFVQFYFGLPLAMVVLSIAFIPRYYGLRVFTAYEYLESRFDLKTRQLAAFLFLVQRGLSAGITIYAPGIILSTVLGWSLNLTCVLIGGLVVIYTVAGGTRTVSQTQQQQMAVMLGGMVVAFIVIVLRLPSDISFGNAVEIAGTLGRMNVIDFSLDTQSRYTFWSGLTGGFFLAMAYFGTDQSQVQRYLSARSITQSRLGLLFNGLVKIPMQFLILGVGVMVFVFHQFHQPPVFFNQPTLARVYETDRAPEMRALEEAHTAAFEHKKAEIQALDAELDRVREGRLGRPELVAGGSEGKGGGPHPLPSDLDRHQQDARAIADAKGRVQAAAAASADIRRQAKELVAKALPRAESKDADYIFLSFVIHYLPRGLIGLLLAVVFCAAMSSTASELSALGTTSVVDFYKRSLHKNATDAHYVRAAKLFTAGWGALAILFATFAALVDNLIQAVNILGSLFYGTILGMFLVAFFLRQVRATPVFVAALLSEVLVILVFLRSTIGFLWYNVIGCTAVVVLSLVLNRRRRSSHI